MIVKNLIRQNLGGVAGYNAKAERAGHGQLLYSNVASTSASEIEQEMGAIAALRPRVLQPGVHMVMALHPSDALKVTDLMFMEMVDEYRRRVGLDMSQAVVWRHHDKPHPHIHGLFNRVAVTDEVVGMWNLKRKLDAFQADMCSRYGLKALQPKEFDGVHPELSSGRGGMKFGF